VTGAEKWQRMHDPQCVADYGLSVNEAEMRTLPAGRAMLAGVKRGTRMERLRSRFMAKAGEAAGVRMGRIAEDVHRTDGQA